MASVYQPGSFRWGGPKAANGEKIIWSALTVAHYRAGTAEAPYGTCLQIRFRKREIIARIIDHGPHLKGRKLDLTPGAARALRFPGLGRVTFEKVACEIKAVPKVAERSGS